MQRVGALIECFAMPDSFPAPWTVSKHEGGESFVVKDANGFSLTWFHFRVREIVGTSTDRMTDDQARRFASQLARLPDQPRLSPEVRAAIQRLMAERPDLKTEGEAVAYLVQDALTGLGMMALGEKNRGPGARRK